MLLKLRVRLGTGLAWASPSVSEGFICELLHGVVVEK